VRRFAKTHRGLYGEELVGGVSVEVAAEALACMVEQCCYVWFAHDEMRSAPVDLDEAVQTVTHAWHSAMFADR
jgi:hypothetical protein